MVEEKRKDCKECVSHLLVESNVAGIDAKATKAQATADIAKEAAEDAKRISGNHTTAGTIACIFIGLVVSLILLIVNASTTNCKEEQKKYEESTNNRVDNILQTMRSNNEILSSKIDGLSEKVTITNQNTAILIEKISAAEKERMDLKRKIDSLEHQRGIIKDETR